MRNGSLAPDLIHPQENPELFMYASLMPWTLRADVTYLHENLYCKILIENSDVLNSTTVRAKVIREMNEDLLAFNRLHHAIGWQETFTAGLREVLFSTLHDLEDNKTKLDQEKKLELSVKEKEIASKIEDLEFPSEKIPIGLKEAVALFPILLAGGSVVTSELLVKSTKIRHKLHDYRKQEKCKT